MNTELLVENGAVIAYAVVGVLALVGLGVIQWVRRRRDVKRARIAGRLVSYSIAKPRPGPVAVRGTYRESKPTRSIDCDGQRVTLDADVEVVWGTRARWRRGVRTNSLRDRDEVMAIGVMSKRADNEWSFAASPGEAGIQVYAERPRPAPPPLWPWRAPLILVTCGALAYFGSYKVGTILVDVPRDCSESSVLQLEIGAALPLVRDEALTKLERCRKSP